MTEDFVRNYFQNITGKKQRRTCVLQFNKNTIQSRAPTIDFTREEVHVSKEGMNKKFGIISQKENAIKSRRVITPYLVEWLNLKGPVTLKVVKDVKQANFSHTDGGVQRSVINLENC